MLIVPVFTKIPILIYYLWILNIPLLLLLNRLSQVFLLNPLSQVFLLCDKLIFLRHRQILMNPVKICL